MSWRKKEIQMNIEQIVHSMRHCPECGDPQMAMAGKGAQKGKGGGWQIKDACRDGEETHFLFFGCKGKHERMIMIKDNNITNVTD